MEENKQPNTNENSNSQPKEQEKVEIKKAEEVEKTEVAEKAKPKENNQETANANQIKQEENKEIQKAEKTKPSKARKWIVLAFLVLALAVIYVIYRGEYLETLELGEQYLNLVIFYFVMKLSDANAIWSPCSSEHSQYLAPLQNRILQCLCLK